MSDTPPTREALRRALEHCTGAPGCPCGGACGSRPRLVPATPLASPVLSNDGSSSDSGEDPSGDYASESETSNDASIRYGVAVQDWDGLESLTIEECEHRLMCILRKSWAGRDVRRRYPQPFPNPSSLPSSSLPLAAAATMLRAAHPGGGRLAALVPRHLGRLLSSSSSSSSSSSTIAALFSDPTPPADPAAAIQSAGVDLSYPDTVPALLVDPGLSGNYPAASRFFSWAASDPASKAALNSRSFNSMLQLAAAHGDADRFWSLVASIRSKGYGIRLVISRCTRAV